LIHFFSLLGEDIDGETLFNLPQSMMYEIIKPMKERVRFLTEQRALFHSTFQDDSEETVSEKHIHNLSANNSQQVVEQHNINQFTTRSTITYSNIHQHDVSVLDSSTNSEIMNEEIIVSSNEDENKENSEEDEESTFPHTYVLPDLPPKVQQIIDKGQINQFRGHTNARRLLIDAIFTDVTTKYSLL
jgi:hypothetical protein